VAVPRRTVVSLLQTALGGRLPDLLGADGWIEAVPVIALLDRAAFDALSALLCHRLSTEADDGMQGNRD
jgi:hypothetical protein